MAGTKGPREETLKLAQKIAKTAGRKGVSMSDLFKKFDSKSASTIARAVRLARESNLIRTEGERRSMRYYATSLGL